MLQVRRLQTAQDKARALCCHVSHHGMVGPDRLDNGGRDLLRTDIRTSIIAVVALELGKNGHGGTELKVAVFWIGACLDNVFGEDNVFPDRKSVV